MDLRDAAERVGVLYMLLGVSGYLAAFEVFTDCGCCFDLSLVVAHTVHLIAESIHSAVKCIERHGCDLVGLTAQAQSLDERVHSMG